jgi:hypothetical protein
MLFHVSRAQLSDVEMQAVWRKLFSKRHSWLAGIRPKSHKAPSVATNNQAPLSSSVQFVLLDLRFSASTSNFFSFHHSHPRPSSYRLWFKRQSCSLIAG